MVHQHEVELPLPKIFVLNEVFIKYQFFFIFNPKPRSKPPLLLDQRLEQSSFTIYDWDKFSFAGVDLALRFTSNNSLSRLLLSLGRGHSSTFSSVVPPCELSQRHTAGLVVHRLHRQMIFIGIFAIYFFLLPSSDSRARVRLVDLDLVQLVLRRGFDFSMKCTRHVLPMRQVASQTQCTTN